MLARHIEDRFHTILTSPLAGVSASAWSTFVRALDTQTIGAVSASGGYGSFDLRPRRLAELGYMQDLRSANRNGRTIQVGDFILPLTEEKLLADPILQYKILVNSIKGYDAELTVGEVTRPTTVSRAGALAILHRGGRGALRAWPRLFSDTQIIYTATQGLF